MKQLKEAAITFLVGRDRISLEVHDMVSREYVCKIEMNPEQLASALGRLGYTPVESCWVGDAEKFNKTMEIDRIEFPLPAGTDYRNRKQAAKAMAFNHCPNGWEPDLWFNSRNSFKTVDGTEWARTSIRRWV
jgi:hypothetical protein